RREHLARQRRRGHDLVGLRRLRRVPLVAALHALAEVAARLGRLHLRANEAAIRALLIHRRIPGDEVAGLVAAGEEVRAALARPALHQFAAILRAEDAGRHGFRAATLREGGAAEELTAAAVADDHHRAAHMARDVRHARLGAFTLDGPRVLARLRVVLAGEERTEEATARLQPAAVERTTVLLEHREVVRDGDERRRVHLGQALGERAVELLEDLFPAHIA